VGLDGHAFLERRADDDGVLTMVGVEWRPISPLSMSICWPLPKTAPFFRSTTPPSPNDGIIAPFFRVERDQAVAGRDVEDALVALAVVQYDTPRPESWRGAIAARLPSR